MKLDPDDFKRILNPVDFVVFRGVNAKKISDIMLLSKKYNSYLLNSIRRQIEKAISKKRYEWQVARMDDEGST